jgi:RNA polymerase sigma-70 factor, ECF subfamily
MESFLTTEIDKKPDHDLVNAAKRGDTSAFEQLMSRHTRRVLAVALRITKNREDAEDVVQESFHKAFVHLRGFQQASQFSTWITRIGFNESYMVLRRRRKGQEVLPETFDNSLDFVPDAFIDHSPTPEELYRRREHSELITKAINRLGPKTQKAIWLRMFEEQSVEETARMLDISASSVKSRVRRGLREISGTVNRALEFAPLA